ncbi:MAG: PAS domain-containing protein, partial [Poseidonibacter sp.]
NIKEQYHSFFITITIYIVLFSLVLIIASLLFANFAKNILDRYNKELQIKTDSLTHWKNRFELAIIASNDGLWDIDFDSDKIYFSNKWLEISGYEEGEIISFSNWFNLIHKDDKDEVKQLFDQI